MMDTFHLSLSALIEQKKKLKYYRQLSEKLEPLEALKMEKINLI